MNMCLQPPGYTYTPFLWIKYGRAAKKKRWKKKRKSGEREKRGLIPAMLGYKKKVIPA